MINDEIFSKVRKFAYENSDKDDIHGFKHVERVLKVSLEIGAVLNANLSVIKIAALLHDVGRYLKNKEKVKNHAEISAKIAEGFINRNKFNITKNNIENILHSIRTHSFSNDKIPQTLEAKVLSDADKLDALGAIGLYRTIGFTISRNGDLNDLIEHIENKIMKLKNRLFLDISKEIAESREKFIINFYNKIKEEK